MSGAYQWAENAIARIKELERKLKAEKKEKRELEQRLAAAESRIAELVSGIKEAQIELIETGKIYALGLSCQKRLVTELEQRLAAAEAEAQQWKQCAESARNILLATEEELRKTEAQRDALLDFAGTVAPGASWWEDIWEPLLKEQGE